MTIQPMAPFSGPPLGPAGDAQAIAPLDFLAALAAALDVATSAQLAVPSDTAPAPDIAPELAPYLAPELAPELGRSTEPVPVPPGAAAPAVPGTEGPAGVVTGVGTEAGQPTGDVAPTLAVTPVGIADSDLDDPDDLDDDSETDLTPDPVADLGLNPGLASAVVPATSVTAAPDHGRSRPTPPAGEAETKPGTRATTTAAAPPSRDAPGTEASAGATSSAPAPASAPASAPAATSATAPVAPVAVPTQVAAASAPAAPLVANTTPLDRVSAQVFPEVTGLVSRGNGTHRITMTLNPEQLGEVRVVMTMRDGAVHVRMAAGQEARAALLDGSGELTRLLQGAGATETRIVVRELPAAALAPMPPTQTPTPHGSLLSDGGTPDQHAGTRADHQAKDGSHHNTPRSTRTEGAISTGPAPRSIQSVIGTRLAGVDLTM